MEKNYLLFDIRSLALMRMGIAATLLFDLAIRLTDLEAFYSNTGAVPLTMLFEYSWNPYFISIHTISGLWQVQLILFLFAFFSAVMLFIGYRTRLFTIISWFMLLSLHNRNILILQGGDDLLRMVLFWGMFIPWGARYSCDRLLRKTEDVADSRFFSIATLAYLLQIIYIYTGSALLKGPEWHTDYTALYYAYSLDQIAYPFTKLIYYYPELMKKLTFFVFYFELLVPVLFFIPFKHAWFRTLGVLSIIVFHGFNSFSLLIGLFPLIGITTTLGLIPAETMDYVERKTMGWKHKIAASFLGYATLIKEIITWKEPVYKSRPLFYYFKTALLIFLILFVFDWNFSNLSFVNSKLSDKLRIIGYGLRLDQSWGMFAPGVFKDDGWFVYDGTTKDGKHVNLLDKDQPIHYKKPKSVVSMFKNDRWRKYSENYIFAHNAFMRGYFCNYYRRIWNEEHPDNQIVFLEILYMKEFTLDDYHYSVPERNKLCHCGL